MIKNTYYKVMNELDDVIATVETRTEAKKIAKKEAKSRKEMLWVIDILNDNEVAVYDEKGEEFWKGGLTKAPFNVIIIMRKEPGSENIS